MKVGVILGSVRQGRMCERVGVLVKNSVTARGHTVTVFDPKDIDFPLLEKPLHWHGPNEEKPPLMVETHASLCEQDAFVFVTPEYNFSLPPALTNFVDHFPYDCWTRKPGSVVTYSMGPFGGMVAGTQLRTLSQVIQLIVLPKGLSIPNVQTQVDAEGALNGDRAESITKNMGLMLDELDFVGDALVAKKNSN